MEVSVFICVISVDANAFCITDSIHKLLGAGQVTIFKRHALR
jgi:hypothetical protein